MAWPLLLSRTPLATMATLLPFLSPSLSCRRFRCCYSQQSVSFLFPSAILLVPCVGIAVWSKGFFIFLTTGFGLLLLPRGGGGAGKDGGEGSGTREVEAASGQGMASSGSGNKAEGLFGAGAKGGKAIWDAVVSCDTR